MRKQQHGRIVNMSSVAGRIARPLSSIYDATKHALEAISDGLRGELAPFGINVILIQPGFIITEFIQVANEIAQPVIEAAGPYAPFFAGFSRGYERAKRIAGHPDDIAEAIAQALVAERPRARYAVPGHARLALALKWLLPDRVFDYLVNRQMGFTADRLKASSTATE
jgi:short-subunit dehydrogenase